MINNKGHWDKVGGRYSNNWKNFAKSKLSEKEINFIMKHLLASKKNNILDIGPGNGRIVQGYLTQDSRAKILGLDISDSMVLFCQEKFKSYSNVEIRKADISKEDIPYENNFDFVSAIRVLKYNENWKDIIKKISRRLEKESIFVFTMINNNSVDRFSFYPITVYKTNAGEIKNVLREHNLDIIEMTSFTKIPDIFYNTMGKSFFLSKFLLVSERALEKLFGKIFLGRIFFIAVKKNH